MSITIHIPLISDNTIRSGVPNTPLNGASNNVMGWSSAGDRDRRLLMIADTSGVPAGATILQARHRLVVVLAPASTLTARYDQFVNAPPIVEAECTWNSRSTTPSDVPWGVAGGDIDGGGASSLNHVYSVGVTGERFDDITALFANAHGRGIPLNMIMREQNAGSGSARIMQSRTSSYTTDPAAQPYIEVMYEPASEDASDMIIDASLFGSVSKLLAVYDRHETGDVAVGGLVGGRHIGYAQFPAAALSAVDPDSILSAELRFIVMALGDPAVADTDFLRVVFSDALVDNDISETSDEAAWNAFDGAAIELAEVVAPVDVGEHRLDLGAFGVSLVQEVIGAGVPLCLAVRYDATEAADLTLSREAGVQLILSVAGASQTGRLGLLGVGR